MIELTMEDLEDLARRIARMEWKEPEKVLREWLFERGKI